MKLARHSHQPILLPDATSPWESLNVFNPAVVHHNGIFHMLYRAQGHDFVSRIGYAVSVDGISWNRMRDPVFEPHDSSDSRGVEDPRVTRIGDTFYMAYTAYNSEVSAGSAAMPYGGGIVPMFARSKNLVEWERIGPLVVGEDNKDHVLFPRQIDGKYVALHRRWPDVWIAYSDDIAVWDPADMTPVYGPRVDDEAAWDRKSVGSNGVPIETAEGWLLLNHGYDDDHIYQFGVCLVDLDDPTKVLARPTQSIFEPKEIWEVRGDVPNVVFSNANPVVDGVVYVYYGGGDHAIGLATCRLDDLLDFTVNG